MDLPRLERMLSPRCADPLASRSKSTVPAGTPLYRRLLGRRGRVLYLRNAAVSTLSFLLDLLLIWTLVEKAGLDRFLAVGIGFVLANAFHYLLARAWIFPCAARGLLAGYVYFLGNALLGLAVIMATFALLTEALGVPYLLARVAASLCAGTLVFVLNATLNFRQL